MFFVDFFVSKTNILAIGIHQLKLEEPSEVQCGFMRPGLAS